MNKTKFFEIYINNNFVGCVHEELRYSYLDDLRGIEFTDIEGNITFPSIYEIELADIEFRLVLK